MQAGATAKLSNACKSMHAHSSQWAANPQVLMMLTYAMCARTHTAANGVPTPFSWESAKVSTGDGLRNWQQPHAGTRHNRPPATVIKPEHTKHCMPPAPNRIRAATPTAHTVRHCQHKTKPTSCTQVKNTPPLMRQLPPAALPGTCRTGTRPGPCPRASAG